MSRASTIGLGWGRRSVLVAVGMAALFFGGAGARASEASYPDHVIKLVVPWSAGGSTDVLGRVLAQAMGETLKTTFIVENRPGATGTIGYANVAKAEPDGYTVLLGTNSTFAIAPHFYKNLPYSDRDFAPLGMIGGNQQILCVNPSLPVRTIQQFVDYVKANPGKITFESSGQGGSSHLAMELFMSMTGTHMLHIPYRGGAPALQSILTNETNSGFVDISVAVPLINSGKLIALGSSGLNRAPALPKLTTISEAGVTGFDSLTTFGLFVPAGTPKYARDKLGQALNLALKNPTVLKKLDTFGFELTGGSAEQFPAYAAKETAKWGKVIEERHIKLD